MQTIQGGRVFVKGVKNREKEQRCPYAQLLACRLTQFCSQPPLRALLLATNLTAVPFVPWFQSATSPN